DSTPQPPSDVPPSDTHDQGTGGAGGMGGAGGTGGAGGCDSPDCIEGPPTTAPPAPLVAPTVGAAQRISGELPRYTERARTAGVEGTVAVKICVSPQGGVSSVTLLRGLPLLDELVLNTIRAWRYKPFTVGGHAMPFCYVANFEFHLQGR